MVISEGKCWDICGSDYASMYYSIYFQAHVMVFVDLDLGEDLVWYSCPGHLMGFLALCQGEGSKELGDGFSAACFFF